MQKESEHTAELLFKYFSNRLTEAEERELLIWLEEDLFHKETLSQMADWWAAAHIPLFTADIKTDFRKHLKKLAHEIQPIRKKTADGILFWYKIAASILILITVAISSFYLGKSLQPEDQIAYYETFVPLGSQSKVILPDQSTVWLNAGSSLAYHENHNNKTRNVSMTGEGLFEVNPNPDKPFIVQSADMHITVLGTSFNLKAYENEATINLVLITGKVDVNLTDKTKNRENYLLSPNQMLTYNKDEQNLEISTVSGLNYCRWKDRQLKFDEQTFIQLARDLERIYNTPIEIKSDRLKDERYSGSFSYDYSLNDILREIDIDKKYKWEYHENKLIIRDK